MADNNTNVIVIQQLLHVQQQQAEDEQAMIALPQRHRSSTASPAVAPHWPRSAAANTAVLPPMIAVAPPSNRSGNSMGSPCPQ